MGAELPRHVEQPYLTARNELEVTLRQLHKVEVQVRQLRERDDARARMAARTTTPRVNTMGR